MGGGGTSRTGRTSDVEATRREGEAVASAFIIGSLPPGVMIVISVLSPTYMSPLFTDPRGRIILGGGALLMALGVFVMRRMINFRI